jgi:tetratricopeptide (TPR) repeat protein
LIRQSETTRDLGEAYLRQGDYTSALRKLLEAESMNPKDPFLQHDLGLAYMAKGSLENAENHFKKAIAIKPDYAPAKNSLGAVYLTQKKWDTAISVFKELTGDLLYATPHYPLTNLGWAYYNKQQYEVSEKYYREAIAYQANYPPALRGLGRTCAAMGRIEEAIEFYEKAIARSPRFFEAYFDLGGAYGRSGDYEKALAAYEKVRELAPEHPLAKEAEKEILRIKMMQPVRRF